MSLDSSVLFERPKHGGNALAMRDAFNLAEGSYMDLTAAINPYPYPVNTIPNSVWQQLPQNEDGLDLVAADYYGVKDKNTLMMVPGSSWAISHLPRYFEGIKTVWLPKQGFKEHEFAWRSAGHLISEYDDFPPLDHLKSGDLCVLINPNNPTSRLAELSKVDELLKKLDSLNGYLIVDEAFMDMTPEQSIIGNESQSLIVMRSFGKFFGLAGLRLGAFKANSKIIQFMSEALSPWAINSPARYIAKKAFQDQSWQIATKDRLNILSHKLGALLDRVVYEDEITPSFSQHRARILKSGLFHTLILPHAKQLHHGLAREGVFTRLLDDGSGIRFGLPRNSQLLKLEQAINNAKEKVFGLQPQK